MALTPRPPRLTSTASTLLLTTGAEHELDPQCQQGHAKATRPTVEARIWVRNEPCRRPERRVMQGEPDAAHRLERRWRVDLLELGPEPPDVGVNGVLR